MSKKNIAYYHLPGLFEFYELYEVFLPIYREHRDYFYDWCEIGSIYGAPQDCIWGGGRACVGDASTNKVLNLLQKYKLPARLTFSNSLLSKEHLSDKRCNDLCKLFEATAEPANGIIIYSDLLLNHIKYNYPGFYFVSSTTKVLTKFEDLKKELEREEFKYVVPDFRHNKSLKELSALPQLLRDKVEFLCNECCYIGCADRKSCYENVSKKCLGEECEEHICRAPDSAGGYRFSKAMDGPAFIGTDDITDIYLPMGFSQFKLEGRGLGSAVILELLLYYMTKPQYRLKVRELIYLDSMLDLF